MKLPKSKTGLTLSSTYLLVSTWLIASQGLFGESFIAAYLGLPWSVLTYLFFPKRDLYTWILVPLVANTICIYWLSVGVQKLFSRRRS